MVTTFWCIDEIEGTISTWQPDNKDIKNKIKNKRKWKKFRLSKPDYGGKRGLLILEYKFGGIIVFLYF